jgi:glycerol-1-phosphate dehydrogenase [NAD(P)+]
MTGYTSLTASITVHGHKLTLPAHAAAGVFFDLGVLSAAPPNMIRAGLGDTICRSTAQADWLLSHLLLGTDYRLLPFDLLAADETQLLEMAAALLAGDLEAMRVLIRTLALSGLGTAIIGSSAPASQAEHLISHYIDMLGDPARPMVLHGEQVGVTTLSSARLQRAMLAGKGPPVVAADARSEGDIAAHFGAELAPSIWVEFAAKRLDGERVDALNHTIASRWDDAREQVEAVRIPVQRIERVLAAAGAPLTPGDIHLDRGFYESAMLHAREIRNRFTFLDLAAASGRLVPLLPSL